MTSQIATNPNAAICGHAYQSRDQQPPSLAAVLRRATFRQAFRAQATAALLYSLPVDKQNCPKTNKQLS